MYPDHERDFAARNPNGYSDPLDVPEESYDKTPGMRFYAQQYGSRAGHWMTIGDEARSLSEAAGYIGRYADAGKETRIVVYFSPAETDGEFTDRMVD